MSERELKPCPFCGSNRIIIAHKPMCDERRSYFIRCRECEATGPKLAFKYTLLTTTLEVEQLQEQAIVDWNRRTGEQHE